MGDFYENGFMEGFCGEFRTSVAAMWPFMLVSKPPHICPRADLTQSWSLDNVCITFCAPTAFVLKNATGCRGVSVCELHGIRVSCAQTCVVSVPGR